MGDLIPKNTDDEMERYNEADMIRRARIPMENNAALVYEVDPVSKREVALFPLSSGGYVKIGDRAMMPDQAAETDVLAAQATVQNDGRTPIGMVMGGADGPTMEDYEAAGFTEAEVIQFQAQERAEVLSQPGVQVPVQLTPEQVQMGVDVGAPMLTTRDATRRESATEFLSGAGEGASSQFLREVYEAIGLDEFEARRLAEAVIGNPDSTRDFGFGLADLTPAGIIFGVEEGYNTFQRGLSTDDPLTAGLGALEAGLSVLEAAPMVGAGVRGLRELATPAMREAINTLRADAIGAGRAVMQGDTEMLGEVFQPSGTPTSLGAAAPDPNAAGAIIRPDDVYRGEGPPRITVRQTKEPFVVRGTQQSQIDDMIQSGLVRPKPGGYGAAKSAQLYFGESSEALPTNVFGRPLEDRFVLVGDSDKLAGTEGPIPIDQLRHVWAVRDGETIDILPEILRANREFDNTGQ